MTTETHNYEHNHVTVGEVRYVNLPDDLSGYIAELEEAKEDLLSFLRLDPIGWREGSMEHGLVMDKQDELDLKYDGLL